MGEVKTHENDQMVLKTARFVLLALLVAGIAGGVLFGISLTGTYKRLLFIMGRKLITLFLFPGLPISVLGLVIVSKKKDRPFVILGAITVLLQILAVCALVYIIFFMTVPT